MLAAIWLLVACTSTGEDSATCDREPALDYDNFGSGFLERHCNGCHSSLLPESHREDAPVGVDFDTYGDVLDWAERIEARAVGEDASMPPGGGPTDEEKAMLAEWLECAVFPDVGRL